MELSSNRLKRLCSNTEFKR